MLSAKQVAPGKTGEIEVSVATEGMTAINKTITVTTNDPQNQKVVLSLTAVVQPEFVLSARNIYFGNVARGREASKEILITLPMERQIQLLSVESTDSNFSGKLEPVAEADGRKVRLIGVMKPEGNDGYHNGFLVIKTSSSLTPSLKITVGGVVVSAQNN